jgi:RNA polymerase sigma factor (sigma-70 family)
MPTAKLSSLVTRFGRGPDAIESATDAELLQQFIAHRDESAFAELVKRHGRLVYGVCRRVTGDHHLAEDAFQAVFVVLAAKAASIRPPSAVAAWLHGVACRTALRARTMRDRRRRREVVSTLPDASSPEPHEVPDAVALLDEEIARLPDHYRLPVVLCELEGVGRKDAARRLGIAEGTLSSRLAAARRALAERLRSRGVALSAAGLSAALAQSAGANPPAALAAKAVAVATPASVPASVAALSQGVLRIMFLHKLKFAAPLAVLALALLTYAAAAAARLAAPAEPPTPPAQKLVLVAGDDPAPAKAEPKPQGSPRLLVWRKAELVMIDPDGKNEKVVVTKEGGVHPSMFALSPDGTKVAVVQPPKGEFKPGEQRANLFVYEIGKEGSEVDLGPAGIAHWSANSKELSVCTFEDTPKPEDIRVTYEVVDLATKKRTPIKLPKDHLVLDRSRDGKSFLTVKVKGELKDVRCDLFLMNADGSQNKQLLEDKPLVAFARLSPDAKRVLWLHVKPKEETAAEKKAREDAGGLPPRPTHQLKVIDIATAKFKEVADIPLNGEVQGFCWSPDGKRIAYTWREVHKGDPAEVMRKETSSHLVTCDPDGKNQKTLLSEKGAGAYEQTLEGVDWQVVIADAKPDAEKLAGAWKLVSVTKDGKETETEDAVFTFEKEKITFKRGNRTMEVTYKLDAAKSPKWIDLTVDGETTQGIYELDRDDLKICLNEARDGKRPDKFVSEAGTPNQILFVLKREKP